eukprot:3471023-Pleurochrysis_carterae.AAC.2
MSKQMNMSVTTLFTVGTVAAAARAEPRQPMQQADASTVTTPPRKRSCGSARYRTICTRSPSKMNTQH